LIFRDLPSIYFANYRKELFMKNLLFAFLATISILACDHKSVSTIDDCGYCPNNTACLGDVCGCPDENTFDMGSWCLRKKENMFVAEMFGCPCFETFGLIFINMEPDTINGGVNVSGPLFSMASRENSYVGFQSNGLQVIHRSDGDSIILDVMPLPKRNYPQFCQVKSDINCWANLYGKFQGPDTIRATIRWGNCRDERGNFTTFDEECSVLLTRWE